MPEEGSRAKLIKTPWLYHLKDFQFIMSTNQIKYVYIRYIGVIICHWGEDILLSENVKCEEKHRPLTNRQKY